MQLLRITFLILSILLPVFGSTAQEFSYAQDSARTFSFPTNTALQFRDFEGNQLFIKVLGDIWIRHNKPSDEHLHVFVPNLYIEHFDIFKANNKTGTSEYIKSFGLNEPFSGLGYGLNFLAELPALQDDEQYYFRIRNKYTPLSPSWIPIYVDTLDNILQQSRIDSILSITTSAIIIGLFLFNLILLVMVKDRLYFFYVIYIFSVLNLNLMLSGFYFQYFWPQHPEYNILEIPLAVTYIAFLCFINQLLGSNFKKPWFRKTIYIFISISLLLLFSVLIPGLPSIVLINILGLVIPIFMIAAIFQVKRPKLKLYLLFGYVPLMISILAYTLLDFGVFFNTFVRVHMFQLGIVWELIVFSVYLGSRYKHLESEKQAYQEHNIHLLSEYASKLEREIQGRTAELQEKNKLLESQGEEIISQRDRLAEANEHLALNKAKLERYNRNLESKVRDRTEKLVKTNSVLDKQLKRLEQFSYIAAHNLRAPVARIKGLISLLKMESLNGSDSLIDRLYQASEDLDEVVSDLGMIIDYQTHQLNRELVNVKKTIERVIKRLTSSLDDIEFRLEIQEEKAFVVPAFFDSIVHNCISNSIKFRNMYGKCMISVRFSRENNMHYLSFTDNGMGFDSDKFTKKLFEPFQRFNTIKDGKGLGLYLIKQHVDALDGTVKIKSLPGKGTKIDIAMPVVDTPVNVPLNS